MPRASRGDDIQEDVGAMARWITAKVANEACDVSQLGECPNKGAAAERLKVSLDKLWGEAANFDTGRLSDFLDTLGPATPAAVREVHFDGHLLRRRARQAKRKAGGGELVAALFLDFFDQLARIWTAIAKGGKPQTRWGTSTTGVDTAGLEVGSIRDAGAAEAMVLCVDAGLSSWRLPGRSVDAIHEQLGSLLDKRAVKRTFVGCKADVRKCFDRVSPQAALTVLCWWGAPEWLAALLEDFYTEQERWVVVAGVFALLTAPLERHDGHLEQVRPDPSGQHWHGHLSR